MLLNRTFAAWAIALVMTSVTAAAQSNPRYIAFSPNETKGALYVPDSGPPPHVAFLAMHRTSNFLNHISTRELSRRGYMVLGMNPRFDNNPAAVTFEDIALDVRQGVRFLRQQQGIDKVILIGHSGGGATMAYYQSIAEKGPSVCQGTDKLVECSAKDLEGFTAADKADAIVFMDAHPANGVNALRTLNPSINDERPFDPPNPVLDPFDVKNGYNPKGDSKYLPEFVEAYSQAQSARMNRLIDKALAIRQAMKNGSYFPRDNDVFPIYRTGGNLRQLSTEVYNSTSKPAVLLRNDGTKAPPGIVKTVMVPDPRQAEADKELAFDFTLTVKSFLSSRAIRSKQAFTDIDWCSSNNSTPCAVRNITVPILVMGAQGFYFIRDGETLFDNVRSADKELIYIEGSAHGFIPCTPCDRTISSGVADPSFDLRKATVAPGAENGQYTNVTKNTFDYIAAWTKARF